MNTYLSNYLSEELGNLQKQCANSFIFATVMSSRDGGIVAFRSADTVSNMDMTAAFLSETFKETKSTIATREGSEKMIKDVVISTDSKLYLLREISDSFISVLVVKSDINLGMAKMLFDRVVENATIYVREAQLTEENEPKEQEASFQFGELFGSTNFRF